MPSCAGSARTDAAKTTPVTASVATRQPSGHAPAEPVGTLASHAGSDLDALWAAHRATLERQRAQIGHDARASYRAMEGWGTHGTLEEDWIKTSQRSAEQYDSGRFLIERLGAERYLDPALMATLWGLRQRLVEELGATTHAERMLVATSRRCGN